MSTGQRAPGAVAVLAAMVWVLPACSGATPASNTLPLSSTATTAAPTADALPPLGPPDFPVPPEARTHDDAGALAFTYYFVDLVDHQATVPAGQPIRDLGPDCDECLRVARVFDDAAEQGKRFIGGDQHIYSIADPAPVAGSDDTEINFLVRADPESIVDVTGSVLNAYPAYPTLGSGIRLQWTDEVQGWTVVEYQVG